MTQDIGKVLPTEITTEMKKSYLDYAMSVIVARALPDIRDGLKPVHRRILFAMHEMHLGYKAKYSKSAKIVGETMGKYHPHGDMPIYDALVRLAQDFSMRYPLVKGQGNFGSVDGDPPAAMRYTEAKMAKISDEMLTDIEKDTVNLRDNFDGSLKEPVFLPSRIPNLLLMGSDGIAVGMATRIPPHNLTETIDALCYLIQKEKPRYDNLISSQEKDNQDDFTIKKIDFDQKDFLDQKISDFTQFPLFESDVTVEDIMKFIKGPDFPTGAMIFGLDEIRQAYETGKGKILIRAKANIEEDNKGRFHIIIEEIPYQVNKANLVKKIADLVRDKKITQIADLRDESDRSGLRIVVDLKKSSRPKVVLNKLYKLTQMQTTYPVNMVALIENTPRLVTIKQILVEFVRHRQNVVTRRTIFDLNEAQKRAHILEGLKIALDNLDEVITTIRNSKNADIARINLIKKFALSEAQANAILEMQLRRLAALERQKIEEEYAEILKLITHLKDLLGHPAKILEVISDELKEIKKNYGDERKTKIFSKTPEKFSEEDLIPNEECLITLTKTGYIKRLPIGTYRSQRRGGKGISGMKTKASDEIAHILSCETHDLILLFTNKGRVFALPAWEINPASRQSKGSAIVNLVNIEQGELIQNILPLSKKSQNKFLIMATQKGIVKKTAISEFENIRSTGIIAIKLRDNDQLCWVKPTNGQCQIFLATHKGKSIRFKESDARPMGRATTGVRGIKLQEGDYVVAMEIFDAEILNPQDKRKVKNRDILIVTEKGLGKKTNLDEYPIQLRGGVGVKTAQIAPKTGNVVSAELVYSGLRQIILTSKKAQVIKLPLKNIPRLGRSTQGVILMRFSKKDDSVAAAACI